MALNIKDPETDELARALARETGETITQALRIALGERLARVRRRSAVGQRAAQLQHYIDRARAREHLDDRPEATILGYEEHGLPT